MSQLVLHPVVEDLLQSLQGQPHPLAMRGHLPLAMWPIEQGFHSKGFSDGVIEILNNSWSNNTE